MPGGRTGCRGQSAVDEVARAAAASPRLRLVGVAGYEAARGHDIGSDAQAGVIGRWVSRPWTRLSPFVYLCVMLFGWRMIRSLSGAIRGLFLWTCVLAASALIATSVLSYWKPIVLEHGSPHTRTCSTS